MERISPRDKLATIDDVYVPRIIGELNGQHVKIVKFEGPYVWHAHEHEDEMFFVIDGHIDIHFRDRVVGLDPGELCIVPRGVEHRPVADQRASVMLFEPATTRNTGNVDHEFTIEADHLERI